MSTCIVCRFFANAICMAAVLFLPTQLAAPVHMLVAFSMRGSVTAEGWPSADSGCIGCRTCSDLSMIGIRRTGQGLTFYTCAYAATIRRVAPAASFS